MAIDHGQTADFHQAVRRLWEAGAWDDLRTLMLGPGVPPGQRDPVALWLAEAAPAPAAAALIRAWAPSRPRTLLLTAAARTHALAELAPLLDEPWLRGLLVQEYVLRGADLRGTGYQTALTGLPPTAWPWEPWYVALSLGVTVEALAWNSRIALPGPAPPRPCGPPYPRPRRSWNVGFGLLANWSQQRNLPRVSTDDPRATTGEGARLEPLPPARALARLAWAAERGGDRGTRRSPAATRLHLWRFLATALELDWPADPGALEAGVGELAFWDWPSGGRIEVPRSGPRLSLVLGRPARGWYCSIQAFDGPTGEAVPSGWQQVVGDLMDAEDWDRATDLVRSAGPELDPQRETWRYWIAYQAPAPYQVAAVLQGPNQAGGPAALACAAATGHRWADLAPLLTDPEVAAWFAQERVACGEDLREAAGTHPEVLHLPLVLQDWETAYGPLPDPYPEGDPSLEPGPRSPVTGAAPVVDRDAVARALTAVAAGWYDGRVAVVDGGPRQALNALGHPGRVCYLDADLARIAARLTNASALQPVDDRSLARGRLRAWQALAACAGLSWPVAEPADLAAAAGRLQWWEWTPPGVWIQFSDDLPDEDRTPGVPEDEIGQWLGILVADPVAGWSAGLRAWSLERA